MPDQIPDKPAALNGEERTVMNTHSFETRQILRKIHGFESIAAWAADHHEAPGGTGYPRGGYGAALPWEASILYVADIFQAMVQGWPYGKGLVPEAVTDFMCEQKGRSSVDPMRTEVLLKNPREMISAARC